MADADVSGREAPATRSVRLVDLGARALRVEKWLCMSGMAAVLVVASTLFFYAHPLADDFARAYKGRTQGVVSATILEYFTWTGRWASTALDYFLTSSFDLVRLYPLLLMINPALLAGGLYLLLLAAGVGTARGQRLALTAAALALYWAGMPHPGESIYWLTGGDSTFAGLSVSLLLLAGLLRHPAPATHGSVAIGAGLSLLTVLATGFHELFGLLLCIVLVGGALRAWLARDPRRWLWTVCVVAALVGFLVVYLAPGNAVRRAEFRLAGKLDVALRWRRRDLALRRPLEPRRAAHVGRSDLQGLGGPSVVGTLKHPRLHPLDDPALHRGRCSGQEQRRRPDQAHRGAPQPWTDDHPCTDLGRGRVLLQRLQPLAEASLEVGRARRLDAQSLQAPAQLEIIHVGHALALPEFDELAAELVPAAATGTGSGVPSRARSCCRARDKRERIVPTGTPSTLAISS